MSLPKKTKVLAALVGSLLVCAYFAVSCSLRPLSSPTLISISPAARANPELSEMTHFAIAVSGAQSNSLSAADVEGRSLTCLKAGGQITFPLTLAQLLSGVSVSIPLGTHHITILGYSDTTGAYSSLAPLFAQRPLAKSYLVAEGDLDTTVNSSITLTSTYVKATASDLIEVCPLPAGGVQGLLVDDGVGKLVKFSSNVWTVDSSVFYPATNPGLFVDSLGAAHISYSYDDGGSFFNLLYRWNATGSFNEQVINTDTAQQLTDIAQTSNGTFWAAATQTSNGAVMRVHQRAGSNWSAGPIVINAGAAILLSVGLRAGPNDTMLAYANSFAGTGRVHVATRSALGVWSSTTDIDSAGAVVCSGGLTQAQGKIDPDGFSHLVYLCNNAGPITIGYATDRSGSWQDYSLAVAATSVGFDVSSDGKVHLFLFGGSIFYMLSSTSSVNFTPPFEVYQPSGSVSQIRVAALSSSSFRGLFVESEPGGVGVIPFSYLGGEFEVSLRIASATIATLSSPLFAH